MGLEEVADVGEGVAEGLAAGGEDADGVDVVVEAGEAGPGVGRGCVKGGLEVAEGQVAGGDDVDDGVVGAGAVGGAGEAEAVAALGTGEAGAFAHDEMAVVVEEGFPFEAAEVEPFAVGGAAGGEGFDKVGFSTPRNMDMGGLAVVAVALGDEPFRPGFEPTL